MFRTIEHWLSQLSFWSSCLQHHSTRVTGALDYFTLYRRVLRFEPRSSYFHNKHSYPLNHLHSAWLFYDIKSLYLILWWFWLHDYSSLGTQEFLPPLCLIRNWIGDCVSKEKATVLPWSVGNRNMIKFYFLMICSQMMHLSLNTVLPAHRMFCLHPGRWDTTAGEHK